MHENPYRKTVIQAGIGVSALTLLVVGAFLLIKRAPASELGDVEFFSSTSGDLTTGVGGEEILYTAGQFGEPGEANLWKTAGDFFTVEVPHEWEVNQRDAQGSSLIVFFDPEDADVRGSVLLESASEFASGERLPYDVWLEEQLDGLLESAPCSAMSIGGLNMTCFSGTDSEERVQIFLAPLNDELFVRIEKTAESGTATPLWSVIHSLNFEPSDEAAEEALVIP